MCSVFVSPPEVLQREVTGVCADTGSPSYLSTITGKAEDRLWGFSDDGDGGDGDNGDGGDAHADGS